MSKDIKYKINQDNMHLLDIFHNNSYLELGSIHFDIIKKLLKKKVLNISDIVDFNIQNMGIGASSINNKNLQSILPYLYFDSITIKDNSVQLFITHGLLSYKNKHQQLFAPLVLIPIILTFAHDNIYMQVVGHPVENSVLLNHLKKLYDLKISFSDKLDNIYQLDRYCMQFTKYLDFEVNIENYLTYATITYPQIIINHDKFSLKNKFYIGHQNKQYIGNAFELYHITNLNYKQRLALERAHYGNSFAISGSSGTGKTTTLINIATDAFYRGKKVLFVSNNKDTIHNVNRFFHDKGLDSIVFDLTRSFTPLLNDNDDSIIYEDDYKLKLLDSYAKIDNFEKILSSRILNFRFIDVLKERLLTPNPQDLIPIDDVSGIYKHEYEDIVHSLEVIETKMKKLDKAFRESKFINIPINHNVKYPNQIITLLFQIHKSFSDLNTNSKILNEKYGFKNIPNYAKFRNIVNDFNSLDIEKVPTSWQDENNYHNANDKYLDLKNLIYTIQEHELYLDWDYQNLDKIDIDELINNLLGPYYYESDVQEINNIIENQHQLIIKLQLGTHSCNNFLKTQKRLVQLLDWNFIDDDEAINEIIRLTTYLSNNYIYKKWLNIKNYEINRKRIIRLQEKIKRYHELETLYYNYFKSLEFLNANITRLSNYKKSGKDLKKYRGVDIDELIADFKELKILKKGIDKIRQDFYEATGQDFTTHDILKDYDNFYDYIKSIKNNDYRIKIINFLSTYGIKDNLKYFNLYKSSYLITRKVYQYIINYLPVANIKNHQDIIKHIYTAYDYLMKVRQSNIMMNDVNKKNSGRIKIEEYFKLRDRIKQLNKKKEEIRNNQLFSKLYGQLFNYEKSNINEIGSILKKFSAYVECFSSYEGVKNSLNFEVHKEIQDILNQVNVLVYEISETFKLYGKIFKDGVGNYYYEDFNIVIDYLQDLMKAKDELITYLEITDHLKIIAKYRLYILSNIIINNETEDVVNLFKYTYFNTLYNLFIKKYPEALQTLDLKNVLVDIVACEKRLTESHIQALRDKKGKLIHNTNYDDYLKNSGKVITLTNTFILNQHLNIKNFDLVLIDDAHLTNANEYYKAIDCKQVIIAGEYIISSSASANLISRIRPNNFMNFNYRYLETPLNLLAFFPHLIGVFKQKVVDNVGYEVIARDEVKYITQLLTENNTVTYFTPTLEKKWNTFERVAKALLELHYNEVDIRNIIYDKLHICDVFSGYGFDTDYNVISLSDYVKSISDIYTIDNFANLLLCKKKLIIIDNNNLLREDDLFIESLQPIFIKHEVFNYQIKDVLIKLRNALNKFDIIVHGFYHDLSLVLEKNNQYYGVLLLVNPDSSHLNILEDYREYYQVYNKNGFPIILIWLSDLVNDFENVILYIKKGMES